MADERRRSGGPPPTPPDAFEASASDAAAVTRSRHLFRRQLAAWGCSGVEDLVLVFSELVTNAVIHGGGAVRIAAAVDGDRVRIDVHDDDPTPPHVRRRDSRPGGFGLHIVARLSERWGSRPTPTGKLVWAVVACPTDSEGKTRGGSVS